ncbi:hypothetical protein [uncultured Fibrella sp.]|uniref:hypothetical protein n=1 Tax=uncultured Fibrella sp. TaxID=1284596 RepID=UPI0035CBE880
MISTNASAILFDDFALLTQQFGRQQLITALAHSDCDCIGYTAPNTNCDCAGSPLTSHHDERYTNQIAQPAVAAP